MTLKLNDPALKDVLMNLKENIFLSLNCVKIGQIFSFNSTEKTAQVQIAFKKVLQDGSIKSLPILLDCPVFTIQGGGGSLSFPITKGDECVVLFSDRNIDNWLKKGGQEAPADFRCHSLSDGIVLVGLNPLTNSDVTYVDQEAGLKMGTAKVAIKNNLVDVSNATYNLLTVLSALIDALTAWTSTNAVPGNPVAPSPASIVALNLIKTQLAGLLY
jgi:hypothetical protein